MVLDFVGKEVKLEQRAIVEGKGFSGRVCRECGGGGAWEVDRSVW
jgi:hypothetical protein